MAAIGFVLLVLAFVACIYSIAAYIFGLRTNRSQLTKSARQAVLAAAGLVSASVIVLLTALIGHDFQIQYVYAYTSSDLSLPYLISALWAGNAGSLLFWGWLLSLFAAVIVLKKQARGKELVPYASIIVMIVQAFFLLLLIFVQNPFAQFEFTPAEGVGLNPLLENPGMIFHPPALLAGYAIFAVPFAFAIAALITKRLNNDWLVAARSWALLGWLLLGVGNILGAWWAYAELGWGGYWAWDPVENAGLMPWLVATAFLHSIMIQRRKGVFKLWSMVLIILAFTLTIFGTFITRSDILSSVHTFGETAFGPFFLVFLIISFFGPLALLFYRRKDLKGDTKISPLISRESTFLVNNLLLVGATFFIFLGTILPSIYEAINGARISTNQSFFNLSVTPIFLAIILLAGLCILIGWRRLSWRKLMGSLLRPAIAALVVVIALVLFGVTQWYALLAYSLCAFAIFSVISQWFRDILAHRRAKSINFFRSFWNLLLTNRSRYGGLVVHIAIVIIAIGVVGSSLFDVEREAELLPGESIAINNYTLVYNDLIPESTMDKMIISADITAYKGDKLIGSLKPQVIFHRSFEQPVTEVAIHSTLAEDLYVILAGWETITTEDGDIVQASFVVLVNPLVKWIWIGGGVFLLGGLIAFWPRRRE
jgi:cytochrome c-type biogenesis protein CcmF